MDNKYRSQYCRKIRDLFKKTKTDKHNQHDTCPCPNSISNTYRNRFKG